MPKMEKFRGLVFHDIKSNSAQIINLDSLGTYNHVYKFSESMNRIQRRTMHLKIEIFELFQ